MKSKLAFLLLFLTSTLFSQNQYFQQQVDYKIDVRLDDKKHVLHASESFIYTNNSPDELREIYIHLWPNAYKNGRTALAKQQYKDGDNNLMFISEEDKGYIDSLDFKANGTSLKWEFDEEHIDIAKLILNEALKPGSSVTITTPFRVKIPDADISRLGHVKESYMITQWYPKPAVYDNEGWHPMPYLGQGEFYSEYGSFDVKITVPRNYVVGSTGDLQNETEVKWLNDKATATAAKFEAKSFSREKKYGPNRDPFPESSAEWKTLHYKQDKVHDFGWFADKRFEVLKSKVELPHSKREVTTWAMFTPSNAYLWEDASEYLNDGTYYYSLWNGDYPYNHVTAVDGTIAAGGGMEYPNVTVIGNTGSKEQLEIVIVHEVGHNWFYGILGSNERVHGWMDEGLNTLNEVRYIQTKYPDNEYMSDMILNGKFHFHGLNHHDLGDASFRTIASVAKDQAIETHSAEFTPMNYGIVMYQKTGLIFDYLKYFLGDEVFDSCMMAYYEKWKFKHPQPEDIQKVFETISGESLNWFFKDLIQTTHHIDYKIKSVKVNNKATTVKVKNKGQIDGPIPVTIYTEQDTLTEWYIQEDKKGTVTFEGKEATEVRIDPNKQIPELNRTNNTWVKDRWINKVEPIKFHGVTGYNNPMLSNNYILPALGSNVYDKFMLGLTFHNISISPNKLQYFIAPMYSFGRKEIAGIGEVSYTFLPKKNFKLIKPGISVKRFGLSNDREYTTVSPYLLFQFGKRENNNSPNRHEFLIQNHNKITRDSGVNRQEEGFFAEYRYFRKKPDHKSDIRFRFAAAETGSLSVNRLSLTAKHSWRYHKRNKRSIDLRLFAASNLKYNYASFTGEPPYSQYSIPVSGSNGFQDVFVEDYYFDRSSITNFWDAQRGDNMGNFKSSTNLVTNGNLLTGNIYFQLPFGPSVFGIFADLGVLENEFSPISSIVGPKYSFIANAGIGVKITDVFAVYFPLLMTDNVNAAIGSTNYLNSIRFTINMNPVNKGILSKAL